jgi:hypothetical protein
MTGWREILPIHPAAELFPLMGPEELRALGEDIKQNGLKIPNVLWVPKEYYSKCPDTSRLIYTRRYLIDGRNRLDAAELVGAKIGSSLETIPHEVFYEPSDHLPRQGYRKLADPYGYVVSVNIHRRHLTTAQKGELIEALLKARPERSDRATAKIAQVSDKTVGGVRAALEGRAEIPHVDRRDDTKGRSQPAHKRPLSEVNRAIAEATAELVEQAKEAATAMAVALSDKSGPFPIISQQPAANTISTDNLPIGETIEIFTSGVEPSPAMIERAPLAVRPNAPVVLPLAQRRLMALIALDNDLEKIEARYESVPEFQGILNLAKNI